MDLRGINMAGFIIVSSAREGNRILAKRKATQDRRSSERTQEKLLKYFEKSCRSTHCADEKSSGKRICVLCKDPIKPLQEYLGESYLKSAHSSCVFKETKPKTKTSPEVAQIVPPTGLLRLLALEPLSQIASKQTKEVILKNRKIVYHTVDDMPKKMQQQVRELLAQNKSTAWISKVFDCTEELVQEISEASKPSPAVPPQAPKTLFCLKCGGKGFYSLKWKPKIACDLCCASGTMSEEEPKPVKVKVLKPATAGTKVSKVVGEFELKEPELMPEPVKVKPRAMISRSSLAQRLLSKCKKSSKGGHWHYTDWKYGAPTFAIDGKALPIRVAAWTLFVGPITPGLTPVAKCGIYNCVAPSCMVLIPEAIARSMKKPTAEVIREIRRLSALGNDTNQIIAVMGGKIDPKTVSLVEQDLAYWKIE